jgi:hypothetical protein
MADGLQICITDADGLGVFDHRYLNRIAQSQNICVGSVLELETLAHKAVVSQGSRISALYINGHGRPGCQAVGSGRRDDSTGLKSLQVDRNGQLVGPASWILPILGHSLTDDALVTLSGYKVAAGPEGKMLLRAVARALGVWVQAADADQYPLTPGWEGQLWKCSPAGNIRSPDGDYL